MTFEIEELTSNGESLGPLPMHRTITGDFNIESLDIQSLDRICTPPTLRDQALNWLLDHRPWRWIIKDRKSVV